MAITTYAELQTAVANWTGRSDLTSRIPEFIALAEAKINRVVESLELESYVDIGISGESTALLDDFVRIRSIYLKTTPRQKLEFMPRDMMVEIYGSDTGAPRYYEVAGGVIWWAPIPDGTYTATMNYVFTPPPLASAPGGTNWVLTHHPDVYLYGTLAECGNYLSDPDMTQKYGQLFNNAVDELTKQDRKRKWGGNSMAVRVG